MRIDTHKNPLRIRTAESQERRLAWVLVLPSILLIFGLTIYPVLYSFWLSLNNVSLLNPVRSFAGLNNYIEILSSQAFWAALGRTFYFVLISLSVQTVAGLTFALVLNQPFYGRGFVRALILLPWAIPNIVNGVMWEWILNSSYGALNGILLQIGIISEPIQWLSKPWLALNMVILADTWKVIPLYVIMFLAGLQTIPKDLYEAARIDGSGVWRSFFSITLPLLKPILLVILVLRTMQCFGVFDIVYIMTKGGPADGTMVISFFTYFQTFGKLNFGMGSAISFLVAFVVLSISLVYMRLLKTDEAD
ncbi:carbohydrate ABC transporter permease [Paenibacillus abyssi]|uniref:ABC transporter permease n=1 Tax=Paenibacillus abyssi TaxID=1340531 RepID=A0A917G2W4_9BACL|nr:sugar ABC transporter permease [Paenibacillus abyssi]GGG19198.1 ABC transporter permease [Paenibacillus abyssi]